MIAQEVRQLTPEKIEALTAYYRAVAVTPFAGGGPKPARRYSQWLAQQDHALWALRQMELGMHPGRADGWKSFVRGTW